MILNHIVLLVIFNLACILSHSIDQTNLNKCSQDLQINCLEANTEIVDQQKKSNIIEQKKCPQLDGFEACNEFDTSASSSQIPDLNENNQLSNDNKYPNLDTKIIISSDEQKNSDLNIYNKNLIQNEILQTDTKNQEQTHHQSLFQRGFRDPNLNKALIKHEKYLQHNSLLREYNLVVHNDLPFCANSTTHLNNSSSITTKQLDFFEVTNLLSGFFNLEYAIVRYEQRNMNYKMKGEFFLPFFVELYPHYETILQKERGILRLFQEKQGGGDCILFLLNKDSYSYSSLPLSFDFHFEYVELKNKTDVNQLSSFQLLLHNAHRIAVLNTPTNLMLIDSLHCAIHSFVLIGQFQPMMAYFHLGYAVCSLSLFEALFPHLAQGTAGEGNEEEVETLFLEYDLDEIAELSESRTNMNINNEKKFTYQSVMQSKQIAGYLAVTIQDHIQDMYENVLKKSENLKFQEKNQNKKQEFSVFKLVSTFDVHSRLTLFNVQTLTDILNEPLESNGPVLAETFELADRLVKESNKITQHKHYRLILDEKAGFCVLEKTGNVFIIAFDLIRRTFYIVIKWIADHL